MVNAIVNSLYTMTKASLPNTLLISNSTTRFNKKLFLQWCAIEFLPMNWVVNFYRKLNLVFVTFINSPMLPAFVATKQVDPIASINFFELFEQIKTPINLYEFWQFET